MASSNRSPKLFARSVHAVAPISSATLLFKGVGGVIVEVEAYHQTDPAAHSFGGRKTALRSAAGLCLYALRYPLVSQLRV